MAGSPPRAGLLLVKKLDQLLGITEAIDVGGPPFTSRKRGLGLGPLMVSLAEPMLVGGNFLWTWATSEQMP